MKKIFVLCLVVLLMAISCQTNPSDDSGLASQSVAEQPTRTSSTLTPIPSPSHTPSLVPSPSPSIVAETVTATLAPTETIMPTATSMVLPTAALSPTSTPSPTTPPRYIRPHSMPMIYIGEGDFLMGTSSDSLLTECRQFRPNCQSSWFKVVEPAHTVFLDAFYMDVYEVSNERFVAFLNELGIDEQSCLGENCLALEDSRISWDEEQERYVVDFAQRNHPVVGVTWFGAAAFCEWQDGRLPTEAEWEKAASWDSDRNLQNRYPWGNAFDGLLTNFCDESCTQPQSNRAYDDGFEQTAPAGAFANGRSSYGIYNMAGNVWEWAADWFASDYYENSPTANPQGPEEGTQRVVRGGSWFDTGNFVNAQFRSGINPTDGGQSIGFRCVLDLPVE